MVQRSVRARVAHRIEWRLAGPLPTAAAHCRMLSAVIPGSISGWRGRRQLLNATRLFLTFREAEQTAGATRLMSLLADLKSANNLSGRVVAHPRVPTHDRLSSAAAGRLSGLRLHQALR